MALRLRLARRGSKKRPFYHIVVAENTAPRDGCFLEKLGYYNPMVPKDHADRLSLNQERIKHWLGTGALPTDRVARFLGDAGITDKFTYAETPKQSAPKAKALAREKEKTDKAQAAKEAAAAKIAAEEAAKAAAEAPTEEVSEGASAVEAADVTAEAVE
ncbi:MAG: 30S ribosomal protein S16 [Alphaproteobacteria bacterium]|nr:MAG: 30S ribosomal protein S16 [Alphaproteobacteria bacterium]